MAIICNLIWRKKPSETIPDKLLYIKKASIIIIIIINNYTCL